MTSIHEILKELRVAALDERDKGSLFEKLTKTWFEVSPEYSNVFDKVWLYADWAAENGISRTDVGIDLVARDVETQEICGIQCKFYAEDHTVQKKDIDSFFTALSRRHFSFGIIVSTSKNWSSLAESALEELTKPVVRIGLHDLENSGVDWSKFSLKNIEKLEVAPKKVPYEHQRAAISDAIKHFSANERGKLVMACGTGKTFTSLRLAEQMVPAGGTMLFLVPSIALLSQSLKEWKQEAENGITAYAVCSDVKVGKSKSDEDIQVTDLAYPATTDAAKLAKHFDNRKGKGMTVIFSTYQSIEVISKAQKLGLPEFHLIVCDEAHRTTGVTLAGADESSFVRVHDDAFLKAKKRLYMTATPRIYAEQSKQKAADADATLASMDNEDLYGMEFHRLNFGKAVSAGLLSDYKVLVLAVSEEHVSRQLQKLLTRDGELDLDDATKIVGCYNGLRKRSNNPDDFLVDSAPMKSAVAFSRSIKDSQRIANMFQVVTEELNNQAKEKDPIKAEADHVDGTYNMESRLTKLDWLKEKTENTVRVLSNARCLSEGVDVPALDAVLFLNPRDSQVDVVQSVGRVMRRSPGKQYGYVILPITVPSGKTAEEALEDNNRYKVVWKVLQALRSHDERFNAMVNKIDLTGDTDDRFKVIGVGGAGEGDGEPSDGSSKKPQDTSFTLDFPLEDWKNAILAKIVQKVGQRTYWENWAADVAEIAKNHISRISHLVTEGDEALKSEFPQFLRGLQNNLNPSITSDDAIEMLSQHLITKPVFDALFEGYAFTEKNPVSIAMQRMVAALEGASMNKDSDQLEGFYESVRMRASGISDGAVKQKIVKELYEKFFRLAFAGTSDKLGIVYTPNEIVDFIIHSTEAVLKKHFRRSLSDEHVHVLDPFTGTGTFLVRLLQSGLIRPNDLIRKYKKELHANEIVLLAYYVAAVNIEQEFHAISGASHTPFDGVVLTDTFQMFEGDDRDEIPGLEVFPENNDRVVNQKSTPIKVIIGNPPYSVGQSEANENNQNAKYETLDRKISETYAELSTATLKYRLYDSYVRAIRWATDRIGDEGVVSYVINNGILDKNTFDGFRKTVRSEFSDIYIVNLRGNSKVGGESATAEGGNVFDIRVGVTVITFVKDGKYKGPARIRYWETPDAASKAEKFQFLESAVDHENLPMVELHPNESGDWINQRDPDFDKYPVLGSKNKSNPDSTRVFETFSLGIASGRDAWVYNFDAREVEKNVSRMVDFYSSERARFSAAKASGLTSEPNSFVSMDPTKISWGADALRDVARGTTYNFNPLAIRVASYRPFCDMPLYLDPQLVGRTGQTGQYFPVGEKGNVAIALLGAPFGTLVVNKPTDLNFFGLGGQVFPKYTYPGEQPTDSSALFADLSSESRISNVSDKFLSDCAEVIGRPVSADEAFDYIYGLLQSDGYSRKYASNLAKAMPRIPIYKNFETFRTLGHQLIDLHLSLESQQPFPAQIEQIGNGTQSIKKMRIVKNDKDLKVIVNESLSISGIPIDVLNWKLGVKSALEWYVDRFSIRQDANSGISNDPNSIQGGTELVIQNLLKLVSLSLKTLELKSQLPAI
jgi:predicted helicase